MSLDIQKIYISKMYVHVCSRRHYLWALKTKVRSGELEFYRDDIQATFPMSDPNTQI